MKGKIILVILLVALLVSVIPCLANVDPILLDEPNDNVFGCNNDIFIELMEKPTIGKSTSGRTAVENYLYFKTEILFLADRKWTGLDKKSFSIKNIDENGKEEFYPLDYAVTMLTNLKNGWNTLSDPLFFTSLSTINLVFDVVPTAKKGWTLLFLPTERGNDSPYCEVEIPLVVK
ncbi:hypothetical protein [Flexilinea flocculi]|jgi:hypothetical protein|uniref:Uncharacterized protein n=1 Tax=Flexilinea flocculi TaxID=1678840 RepID=A0A0K8PAM1_9CHLR|nr:hypothetical protein [Flexilinea flocculi]GAP39686.1 hypothetical protein ATC1_12220 [Flexilinea flocculi]